MNLAYSMLLPLMMTLTAGGQTSDLLDLMPTQSYWQTKHVTVSADAMLHELEAPKPRNVAATIDELGSPDSSVRDAAAAKLLEAGDAAVEALTAAEKSPDPNIASSATDILQKITEKDVPAGVRRLMAIRTLGELKEAKALPVLKAMLDSKRRFEADYAQEAINVINGKPTSRPMLDAAVRRQDLAMLSGANTVIGQFSRRGEHGTVDALLKTGIADDKTRQEAANSITEAVLKMAEQIGNVRIDGASVGAWVENPGSGTFVMIAHGSYNSRLVRGLFPKDKMKDVGGVLAYCEEYFTLIAAADDRLILITNEGAHPDEAFMQKLLAAMNTPATAKQLDELAAQQNGVDINKAMWLRVMPQKFFAKFAGAIPPALLHTNEFVLTADNTTDGTSLQLVANCDTADDARALMGLIRVGIGQIKVELIGHSQIAPEKAKALESVQAFLGNIKLAANDKAMTASAVFTNELVNTLVSEGLKGSIQRDVDRPEEPIAPQVQEVKPDVKPAK